MSSSNNHKKLIVLAIAGMVAVGIFLTAPVYALTGNGTSNTTNSSNSTASNSQQQPATTIHGSLKISSILDQIISKSGTTLADATSKAASTANGNAVSSRLAVVQGYLVYEVKVLSDDGMHVVIIDAGNGDVLFTSPAQAFGGGHLLGGEHHFKHHMEEQNTQNNGA